VSTPIHSALHFDTKAGLAFVGITTTSRGALVARVVKNQLGSGRPTCLDAATLGDQQPMYPSPEPYKGLVGRWSSKDVEAFCKDDESAPTLVHVLTGVRELLAGCIEFPVGREGYCSLVACWIVGTYFFPLFTTYPRLHVTGERGCGKSKLLGRISALAFNGLFYVSPTPATLFRLIEPFRPTLCLDEMEELPRPIEQIVNSGYKDGGAVPRAEERGGQTGGYGVQQYAVYAPMALGSIAELKDTPRDRAIVVRLERGCDPAKLNSDPKQETPEVTLLRNACYRLALTRFRDVHCAETAFEAEGWLQGRHRELYKPLLALAAVAAQEGDASFQDDLIAAANTELQDRPGLPPEGFALFAALDEALGTSSETRIYPNDIANAMRSHLEQPPEMARSGDMTGQRVGPMLQRYGFPKLPRDRRGIPYRITRARWNEQAVRFGYNVDDDTGTAGDPMGNVA